ncbi:MAG: hypothetical protein JNN00_01040 [Chitinophagaceae bacterium]|nr:hypothetical protein [Chitinophagaceae bacterium]
MKRVIPFSICIFLSIAQSFGQRSVYDSTDKNYRGIDFSFKDDFAYWRYDFRQKKATKKNFSIGHLTFWRAEKWDNNNNAEFHSAWTPGISFDIYNLKDSAKAKEASRFVRSLSLCQSYEIGGDLFVVGNFIFVNPESCVLCYRKLTNKEYCRPTINIIFSNIDTSKVLKIRDIIDQFPIQQANVKQR